MPPATNRTQRKRPGDLTGVRGQQLAAAAAREKEESKRQVQAALEEEREDRLSTDVDYSSPDRVVRKPVRGDDGELSVEDVVVTVPKRHIRVNYPIDEMTFGKEVISQPEYDDNGMVIRPAVLGGLRNYKFEEGRWYTVDADVADHLAFLGYVYEI